MFDIRESGPKGAWVLLKGTKAGALFCVTSPKPVSATGLLNLGRKGVKKINKKYI
jgi:hypothetical protein